VTTCGEASGMISGMISVTPGKGVKWTAWRHLPAFSKIVKK
jgi:ammonia channel protein AmtB